MVVRPLNDCSKCAYNGTCRVSDPTFCHSWTPKDFDPDGNDSDETSNND